MFVVDTNVIAYLYLPTDYSKYAEALLLKDPHWVAPVLWRSELRNVLTQYVRKDIIDLDTALDIQAEAEELLKDGEYHVTSTSVLTLTSQSKCSAYDCEFIALARSLDKQLVTVDKKIIREFPENCVSLKEVAA